MEIITLTPRLVEKMWGSRSMAAELGKADGDKPVGESWEVYDFPPGVVDAEAWASAPTSAGGTLHELMRSDRDALLGPHKGVETPDGEQFPLLVKFLFAGDDLSVQVHPDDDYAAKHPDAHLKNECWTIMHTETGARLLAGLEDGVSRERFEQAIEDGTLEDLLGTVPAVVGRTHYLPSGTVHALGGGCTVAEIQTPSDTTYRVFDFNRVDPKSGRPRELHVRQALECINFDDPNPPPPAVDPADGDVIVRTPQFTVTHRTTGELADGFAVLVGLDGTGQVAGHRLGRGDVLLLPHEREAVAVESPGTFLEVRLPG